MVCNPPPNLPLAPITNLENSAKPQSLGILSVEVLTILECHPEDAIVDIGKLPPRKVSWRETPPWKLPENTSGLVHPGVKQLMQVHHTL